MTNRLQDFVNATAEWSDATFGANRSPVPILHHLEKELPELIEAVQEFHKYKDTSIKEVTRQDMHMEFADIFILILDAARCTGLKVHTLVALSAEEYGKKVMDLGEYLNAFKKSGIPATVPAKVLQDRVPKLIGFIETFNKDNSEGAEADMLRGFAIVFSIALYAARLADLTAQDIIDICWEKLEINQKRKWGEPDANGVCEHIKE